MAADVTVDDYLDALRHGLRGHQDRDGLLDEVEDHLRSAVDCLRATGMDLASAEAETVRVFGQPELIAEALLATNGCPAVPTSFTQGIGAATVVGSAAWLVLAGAFWASHLIERDGSDWEGVPRTFFMLGMAGLAASAVLTLLLMLALRQRQGGFGRVAMFGIGVTGLAAAASAVAWAIPLWAGLFSVGCLPVAVAAVRHGEAPRRWAVAFGAAWPAGLSTLIVLRAVEFGAVDEWGDYPAAYLTGMTIGCLTMFAAFVGLGRWLRSEQPVDPAPHGSAFAA